MSAARESTLLSRIEDAGINASAPAQQRWLDGWLVRFSPGKAKRARCINAVAAGRLAVEQKLELCRPLYAAVQLPLLVRVTPFSEPLGLDERLEALGMGAQDDTRVMVRRSLDDVSAPALPRGCWIERLTHHAFAELVGRFRGSALSLRQAHAERLQLSPVPFHGFALVDGHGGALACGQVGLEAELVGLYDVFTAGAHRNAGLGRGLCAQMLEIARSWGTKTAYLQVEALNAPARHVYRALGFADAYAYHYRASAAPG